MRSSLSFPRFMSFRAERGIAPFAERKGVGGMHVPRSVDSSTVHHPQSFNPSHPSNPRSDGDLPSRFLRARE